MHFHGIYQHDVRDCGVACLATICEYYGLKVPLSYIRDLEKVNMNGSSIYGICEAAKILGLDAEAYQGSITYGNTPNSNIGSAFTSFCREKGLDISSIHANKATFGFYRNCIDAGGIGTVSAHITTTEGISGHTMAVEGYALYKSNDASSYLHILRVADGWHSYARNLNNDFGKYNSYEGYAFQ